MCLLNIEKILYLQYQNELPFIKKSRKSMQTPYYKQTQDNDNNNDVTRKQLTERKHIQCLMTPVVWLV